MGWKNGQCRVRLWLGFVLLEGQRLESVLDLMRATRELDTPAGVVR